MSKPTEPGHELLPDLTYDGSGPGGENYSKQWGEWETATIWTLERCGGELVGVWSPEELEAIAADMRLRNSENADA